MLDVLYDFDRVLGLGLEQIPLEDDLPEEFAALIAKRQKAREAKDWARADEIRKQLAEAGITIEDRAEGTVWHRESGQ